MNTRISVVIPLYNKQAYIRRTIESALRQTTPADEILVIDDGSTDCSADNVLEINDQRIKLIYQENAGECAARNRGILEANNELIAFLDADDEWKPDFLSHINRLRRNYPDCGAYATAYQISNSPTSTSFPPIVAVPPTPWLGIIPNLFKMIQVAPPFYSSSIAIPKNILIDIEGFPEGVKRGGDIITWVKLGTRYPIAYSPSRQVIYHTDALNRACISFPSLEESSAAITIRKLLDNHQVPIDLIDDVEDYYAWLQIRKAREIAIYGNHVLARSLLRKVAGNDTHRIERLKILLLSYCPSAILKKAMTLRKTLLKVQELGKVAQ